MASESTEQHRAEAEKLPPARVAVLTISDTRTTETDKSGQIIIEKLKAAGHEVVQYVVLPDEPDDIRETISLICDEHEADAILTNGGTGIAPRDGTYEAVVDLIERPLPGFGELFRMLSWDEVGAASMLSRATAGLCRRTLIFCMPGSSNAVTLAMDALILPELGHLVYEVGKG